MVDRSTRKSKGFCFATRPGHGERALESGSGQLPLRVRRDAGQESAHGCRLHDPVQEGRATAEHDLDDLEMQRSGL